MSIQTFLLQTRLTNIMLAFNSTELHVLQQYSSRAPQLGLHKAGGKSVNKLYMGLAYSLEKSFISYVPKNHLYHSKPKDAIFTLFLPAVLLTATESREALNDTIPKITQLFRLATLQLRSVHCKWPVTTSEFSAITLHPFWKPQQNRHKRPAVLVPLHSIQHIWTAEGKNFMVSRFSDHVLRRQAPGVIKREKDAFTTALHGSQAPALPQRTTLRSLPLPYMESSSGQFELGWF